MWLRGLLAPERRFRLFLALIVLGGFLVRVVAILVAYRHRTLGLDDNNWYHTQANLLADHGGFYEPFVWLGSGDLVQSAGHPPGYLIYLAAWSLVGLDGEMAHRIAGAVAGAAAVGTIGLCARYIANLARPDDRRGADRVGLIAAAIAAVYPNLWINDGLILSESLYAALTGVVVALAYRLWKQPDTKAAVLLGAVIGVAALTRSEGATLLVFLVVPLVLVLRGVAFRRKVGLVAITGAVAVAVMAPWIGWNLTRFDQPVYLASGSGRVLAYANCDRTYSGTFLGYWHQECTLADWPEGDESVVDEAHREKATEYIQGHLSRQPVVVAARVGRIWGVFRPFQGIELDWFYERRGIWPVRAALGSYYALGLLAIGGGVALRRRGVTLVPLLALIAMVTVTAATTFGVTRYRVPAEVTVVVLAAVGIDALWRRWTDRRHTSTEAADEDGEREAAEDPVLSVSAT